MCPLAGYTPPPNPLSLAQRVTVQECVRMVRWTSVGMEEVQIGMKKGLIFAMTFLPNIVTLLHLLLKFQHPVDQNLKNSTRRSHLSIAHWLVASLFGTMWTISLGDTCAVKNHIGNQIDGIIAFQILRTNLRNFVICEKSNDRTVAHCNIRGKRHESTMRVTPVILKSLAVRRFARIKMPHLYP